MQKTNIEYITHTWNPIAMRCTPVSFGCDHCWHLGMTIRLAANNCFTSDVQEAYMGEIPVPRAKELSAPLRRKKPSVIGVQFMGDLFHEKVSNEMIAAVFGVMAACPQHRFIVLTKRPGRALEWLMAIKEHSGGSFFFGEIINDRPVTKWFGKIWPLPNVCIGVSIEDQKTADERIPLLLQIPAAKRFVSAEPLLAECELEQWIGEERYADCGGCTSSPVRGQPMCTGHLVGGVDWVICGAETGPGKRPMNLDWVRSLRDQCKAASVHFFFKKDSQGKHTLDGVVHEEMPK